MNDEISEQAKKSLADLARRRAFDRLERDGAQTSGLTAGSSNPCAGANGPANDSPQLPDSPAAFLESGRGYANDDVDSHKM
jgi:hypothetical protein